MFKIAVIGGSISGCMMGSLLARSGHDVCVYERSPSDLKGRGGGIATSTSVIESMKSHQLIGEDFPTVPHHKLLLCVRTPDESEVGRCPLGVDLSMQCVHWSGMFNALRSRLDSDQYQLDKELVSVEADGVFKKIRFADDSSESVDLVVFTDGFRSVGRRIMHPEVQLDYRGFVIWRGTLGESYYNAGTALDDHPRISFPDMPGSFITYLMPGIEGSVKAGERVINWAAYLPMSEMELDEYMVDRNGERRDSTVPAGQFPLELENKLKQLMQQQLPSVFADIVQLSGDTAFQPLRVTRVPSHYKDRMCLVGDAAVAIQPLTGAGAFKAYENARTLAETLGSQPADLDLALERWSETQTDLDERLLSTGFAMEEAFLLNTIDLATSDTATVKRWWDTHIHYPPEYSYLKME